MRTLKLVVMGLMSVFTLSLLGLDIDNKDNDSVTRDKNGVILYGEHGKVI